MAFLLALALSSGTRAENEPLRVISLAPHLTELAYTAGAGETLVGVVEWSDWPAEARELPRIGDAYRFDFETIIGLGPDLALAWRGGTPDAVTDRLRSLGIEVLWIETASLDQIATALEHIGGRLHSSDEARRAAEAYRKQLAALDRTRPNSGVTIFYQVSAQPLFTLGGRHVITEVFETCGARNAFADLDTEAAAVDREAVVARAPDLIIAGRNDAGDDPLATWRDSLLSDGGRTRLEAVDAERLVRPTPRIIEGIEFVCDLVDEAAAGG
jgi:iron complex transport system substrate-binding protein